MKFILDGNNFSTVEGFYLEIERVFTKNLIWKTGHSYAAYDDLLCGGFGMHDSLRAYYH